MEQANTTWIDVCSIDDIDEGGMYEFQHEERRIVVYRLDDGFFATDNVCTHEFALLSEGWLENGTIECPLHGAIFDVKTGKVERGPAECALKTYAIKSERNRILCSI
ncbi:MAG: non-heme iron oxygenase ferredoxin subunit [Parvibaculaceae bacterium]